MDWGKFTDRGILSQLLSIAFPRRCVHCGRLGFVLCPQCRSRLIEIGFSCCRRCGKPTLYQVPDCRECRGRSLYFRAAAAAFPYEGPARSLIHRLKFTGQRRLAQLMADLSAGFPDLTKDNKEVSLTYVPLHRSKRLSRGYNQAELYARALSQRHGLELRSFLVKPRPTSSQNQLNFSERRKNLAGSFVLRRGVDFRGQRVILIDDVYTTGSTVSECAKVLITGLGVEVDVWTFARTVKLK